MATNYYNSTSTTDLAWNNSNKIFGWYVGPLRRGLNPGRWPGSRPGSAVLPDEDPINERYFLGKK